MNLPARLGTYAAAGLPWILKDNRPGSLALQNLALKHDVGVLFRDFADLAVQLRDKPRLRQFTSNMIAARKEFAFDTHADALVRFFRETIARWPGQRAAKTRELALSTAPATVPAYDANQWPRSTGA